MPHHRATYHVDRAPAKVFDVIGTNVCENHPRWEPEVVEIRPVTPGPVRLGSRAVMVRQEGRRRFETTYEVSAFDPDRAVAFHHLDGPMGFDLAFELAPAGHSGTTLTVDVRMSPRGLLKLATPLLALELPRRTDRISRQMIDLVEGRTSGQPVTSLA
jgi:hypothetical protein